ncbi:Fasciclin-like arabinogalactan protein [Pseudocercospora fuligena]|uniref:Fasciclin-like arabinogalactan protein n=1 Tax=Pseudocercospora fuligena TaxID=685502 RepID=A0A8H6R6G8_9PEZI|nr:Fasciclin-like arabinogalactan protein [Pseudocercospora fuligena]
MGMGMLRHLLLLIAYTSSTRSQSLREALDAESSASTFLSLLQQFDLLDSFGSLSNVTVLAPTNQAYDDLAKWGFNVSEVPAPVAKALLSYHALHGIYMAENLVLGNEAIVTHSHLVPPVLTNVTNGAAVKLSRGQSRHVVTESGLQVIGGTEHSDIIFDAGVIHMLNSSMVLPHNISVTAEVNQLTEFLDAVEQAGLISEFESQADVTVLIPYNGALHGLQQLMKLLSTEQMASILRYHVVPNEVLYQGIIPYGKSKHDTLEGSSISIDRDGDAGLTVNGIQVVRSELLLYGGVAHIIDGLLIPEQAFKSSPEHSSGINIADLHNVPADGINLLLNNVLPGVSIGRWSLIALAVLSFVVLIGVLHVFQQLLQARRSGIRISGTRFAKGLGVKC